MANLSGYNLPTSTADQTHNPPRYLKSGGDPRLSGAVSAGARCRCHTAGEPGGIQLTASVIGESDVLEGD